MCCAGELHVSYCLVLSCLALPCRVLSSMWCGVVWSMLRCAVLCCVALRCILHCMHKRSNALSFPLSPSLSHSPSLSLPPTFCLCLWLALRGFACACVPISAFKDWTPWSKSWQAASAGLRRSPMSSPHEPWTKLSKRGPKKGLSRSKGYQVVYKELWPWLISASYVV